jgi:hypothetical protein
MERIAQEAKIASCFNVGAVSSFSWFVLVAGPVLEPFARPAPLMPPALTGQFFGRENTTSPQMKNQ